MELQQISKILYDSSREIVTEAHALKELARAKAEAERKYRTALMRQIMVLKKQGLPATLINDLARGHAADLKYERDLSDEQYKASRDVIRALESQLSCLQSLLRVQKEI